MKMMTKAEWDRMSPKSKGYVMYLQAELPGSELKGVSNPYFEHTKQHKDFNEGEQMAMLEVQDGEE